MMETRTIDDVFRRKRKCNDCGEYFFTKEVFMYMAKDNPNAAMARPKIPATREALSQINRKKVEARRNLEDRREKKLRVPSYFIEEDY